MRLSSHRFVGMLLGVVGLVVCGSKADIVQTLYIPTVNNTLMLQASMFNMSGDSVTYTVSGNTGTLVVTGSSVLLTNSAMNPTPVINTMGTYSLTAKLNFSNANQIVMTSGTLSITNGGNDISASAATSVSQNFGFDVSGSGSTGTTELDFLFLQNAASPLPGITPGTYLGEKLILGDYTPTGSMASSIFSSASNFNLASTALGASKADTFATVPLPTTALASSVMLSGLFGLFLARRKSVAN